MEKEFDYLNFISSLLKFSPRQLEGEIKAADFISTFLKKNGIDSFRQYFSTNVPKINQSVLKADGKNIPCQGSSFTGGLITGKESLISSLIPSRFFLERANINFNPKCEGISLSNFYFAPAVAVAKKNLQVILEAEKVEATVAVNPKRYKAVNILVGNRVDPKMIFFAHYDSINTGAVDNASGVAVMAKLIISSPETLRQALYVFSAQEELSYDKPVYWGYGFRVFEKRYLNLFKKSKKIIVIDCVGNGSPHLTNNLETLRLAFPINNLEKFQKKVFTIHGDIKKLMKVYHSDLDDISQLDDKLLKQTDELILNNIYVS